MSTLTGLCGIAYEPVKPIDGIDLSEIIKEAKNLLTDTFFRGRVTSHLKIATAL